MDNIKQLNLMAMYFVYGLSFYSMGIAIAFQYRKYSAFRLAKSLWLLAAFGLLHGLGEWGNVFIPLAAPSFALQSVWKIIALQRLAQSLSLFLLFLFGIKLIFDTKVRNYWLFALPITAFASWLILFAFFIPLLGSNELAHWLMISENWARFLLAFPGGLVTAYGLSLQLRDAKKIEDKHVLRNLYVAAASLILFALFSGLIVPQDSGWYSHIVNVVSFNNFVGLPIEVFRTAAALLATRSITRVLTIFDLEKQRQISESRHWETIFRERERFARDLHDDVIQSIYGIGLELQTAVPLIAKDPSKSTVQVVSVIKRLNEVIQGLRAYIQGLETPDNYEDLRELLIDTLAELRNLSDLEIILDFQADNEYLKNHTPLPLGWQRQIKQIVHEALTNVVQHASASKAVVKIRTDQDYLIVSIEDDGCGMQTLSADQADSGRKHMGLQNMRTRAKLLGGILDFRSEPTLGTNLTVKVPLH